MTDKKYYLIAILLLITSTSFAQCKHDWSCQLASLPPIDICCKCKERVETHKPTNKKYYWMSVKYDLESETHYVNFTSTSHPFVAMDRIEEIVRTKNTVLLNWKEISEYEYNLSNCKVFNK